MTERLVHEFGLPEAAARERLRDLRLQPGLRLELIARGAMVTARLQADREGAEAARAQVERTWGPYFYGSAEATLASSAGALLRDRGRRLATAESCTGGWIARLITDVSGSSAYYLGGWVTYADDLKASLLGVPRHVLATDGAVSGPCGLAMARGALERSAADEAIAVTGIAGPGGGTPSKPVGTVFIAIARRGVAESVRRFAFEGDRAAVREHAAMSALQMLRWAILGVEPAPALAWEVPLDP
jgi:PncC family amidohydrolase